MNKKKPEGEKKAQVTISFKPFVLADLDKHVETQNQKRTKFNLHVYTRSEIIEYAVWLFLNSEKKNDSPNISR